MKKTRVKVVPILSSAVNDAFIPGVQIPLSLEEAESYGVFSETALSEEDAWDSCATDFS
ncbi:MULTISPECIES: conjugal transfer protein TraD [Bartonella]|uniref:Conjugal transfer protein TraD n=2 Tax=Bartonella TaxID=773 RepID=A0A5B9RLZ8_9HYPH|nr:MULTISPECIES: conjugal transfer protein TraD [Bartonella]QEG79310.1 conjugal transfer protein TraD [Bartonella kosoyi]